MKTVLAYGDSLTWGHVPGTGERHAHADRWPNVMAKLLGPEIEVVSDGLCGRTTAYDDYTANCDRNATRTLPTALSVNGPLALTVIMLGTNDLQPHIAGGALAARDGLDRLAAIVRTHEASKDSPLLLVSPPKLCETNDQIYAEYFLNMINESQKFAAYFEPIAQKYGCSFFNAATVCVASDIDGVHLDANNTRLLGAALSQIAKELL